MSANELTKNAGTANTSALQSAMRGGLSLPRGLYFDPSDEGGGGDNDNGNDNNNDGAGGEGNENNNDGGDGDEAVVSKKEYDGVLKEMIARRDAEKKLTKELESLKKNAPSKEEISELRKFRAQQQEAEEERRKKEGQFEELLNETKTKYEQKIQELESKVEQEVISRRAERVDNILAKFIPQNTDVPVDDVSPLIKNFFKWDEDGEVYIEVNGEEPLDENGKPKTAERFIADFIASKPWLAAHKPKGGSGGASGRGRGKNGAKVYTAEDLASMSTEDFRKYQSEIMAQVGS